MTKREELAVLDRAIAALGDASYLGPWLASVREEVASIMAADGGAWWPVPSHSEETARQLIDGAQERGREVIAQAERRAADLLRVASDDSVRIRGYAAQALRGALATLEGRKP